MVRPAIFAVAVGAAVLGACAGDDPEVSSTSLVPSSTAASSTSSGAGSPTSTSGGSTTTAAGSIQTPAAPPAPLPAGCSAPTADVEYTSGVATLEITSGPGAGRLDLAVQPRGRNEYSAARRDLKGEWEDPAQTKLLYINVSGGDPCQPNPSAFVRIEAQGKDGPAFADSGRNRCKVELKAFSAQGMDGSFTCTQLGGGGAGVFIDANGTFSVRA